MKKNILMICYYYPPLTDVGCKRSVAFSKYLKKHGWYPFVLSVKNPDRAYCSLGTERPPEGVPTEYSYSLVNLCKFFGRLNGGLARVLRLAGIELRRNLFYDLFCIPDFFWGWIPLAVAKAARIIKRESIDIIYVSCTPFSSAVIGYLLKRLMGKPLVIDFRDAIALESFELKLGVPVWRRRIDQWIERSVLESADVFVVTTDEVREAYISQYPEIKDKIFTVHNGFEPEFLPKEIQQKYEKFTIVYTGEFYFYNPEYIDAFFEALAILKREGRASAQNFQFLFYGDGEGSIEQKAKEFDVEDLVSAHGRIPYGEVLKAISKSHLQLLRIVKPMISTKLFEGIPFNVPFLATIPEGEVAGIITEYSPSSIIVTEELGEKQADGILSAMKEYERQEIADNRITEFLESFSRENLTLKLAKIIEANTNWA